MSWKYSIFLVFALISSGCISEKRGSSQSKLEQGINDSLLEIASHEPEVGSFIARNPDYHTETTVLSEENITYLSRKYPAVFSNLPNKTLYRLEYKSDRGMLLIIDLENKKVLRYFRTAGIILE